ncbi:MAG: DciA family protein [Lautropia sp.]
MLSRDPSPRGRPAAAPLPDGRSPGGRSPGGRSPGGRGAPRAPREPKPALGYLHGTELWATWQRLAALERDLAEVLPALALVPLKLDRQVLTVTAGSAAAAARVRQFEPRLIDGLRARGWLIGRIRFRPVVVTPPAEPPPPDKPAIAAAVIAGFEALAAEDLPPALGDALRRFTRRQRGYLAATPGRAAGEPPDRS